MSISTSSEVFIQTSTLLPILIVPFSTFNLNWYPAFSEIKLFKFLLSFWLLTSGNEVLKDFLTNPLQLNFLDFIISNFPSSFDIFSDGN
jgi:hypothetical protein